MEMASPSVGEVSEKAMLFGSRTRSTEALKAAGVNIRFTKNSNQTKPGFLMFDSST
jgi:hypothetical protein